MSIDSKYRLLFLGNVCICLILIFAESAFSKFNTPEKQREFITEKRNASSNVRIKSRGLVRPSRRELPRDLFNGPVDRLRCGDYVAVSFRGLVRFKINSPGKKCEYAFIGSRPQNCTVAVLCEGQVTITPPDCKQGFIGLFDGTTGYIKGCRSFSFRGTPRMPLNGGSDIYFKFQGTAGDTMCIAFCIEDVTETHYRYGVLNQPLPLKTNPNHHINVDESCTCGIKKEQSGRVVGGEETIPFEFPWLGIMTFRHPSSVLRMTVCGASLITDRHAILAAHCFHSGGADLQPEDVSIVFHTHVVEYMILEPRDQGDEPRYLKIPGYDLPIETDQSEGSVRRTVKNIKMHPLFNLQNYDWDVAIITLDEPVDIRNRKTTPICIPDIGYVEQYEQGSVHTVAGYGLYDEYAPASSRIPSKLDVPLGECRTEYGGSFRHLCLGYLGGEMDACTGDSGGPLMYKFKSHQHILSGIVSAGLGCARPGLLGLYTDVRDVVQWVYHQISLDNATFCKK